MKIWQCSVCKYIHRGENPPDRFISGTDEEKNELYNAVIARLRDLMTNSEITLEEYLKQEATKE